MRKRAWFIHPFIAFSEKGRNQGGPGTSTV
uniref:Uncharacterized protein n=1 Tax=Arundo donax TaxID=35708 RepID=A0A0A9EHT7_ARUDO